MLEHLIFTQEIRDKLLDPTHGVIEAEVRECFLNHDGFYAEDTRPEHLTDPVTEWFIGETDRGRLLKIVFVFRDGNLYLKSAYSATEKYIRIYEELKLTTRSI